MIKTTYAFVVHSRYREDILRKFPSLGILPSFIIDFITFLLPPIIVSNIIGLKDKFGSEVKGLVIGIPMTARQLLENRDLAKKRVIQAVKLAKKKGVKYVGLGAMTASLTRGGRHVIENVDDVYVTTGRGYTIANIVEYLNYCVKKFNLSKDRITIGIVGAAGGIGSGTAMMLAMEGYSLFVLIDIERKLEHLKKHIEVLEKNNDHLKIKISHQVSDVSGCNIIVAATSAPEVVIKSSDVNPGTIIINDAQPSDVSPDIIRNRKDVLVIEGGVLNAPGIECNFNFGLVQKNHIFSCLAETLILSYRSDSFHYSIDETNKIFINSLKDDAKSLGFKITSFQNERGLISDMQLDEFIKFIPVEVK